MANFNNTAVPGLSAAQAQQVMTSNADSVANFFRETSYGQQIMNVTVTGWVTMDRSQPASCGSTDWRGIGTSAEAAAKSLGAAYDPVNYTFVVYVFLRCRRCGWLGLAYVGYPRKAWINGTSAFRTSTIAHEMGHNFGLLHAASLRCTGAPSAAAAARASTAIRSTRWETSARCITTRCRNRNWRGFHRRRLIRTLAVRRRTRWARWRLRAPRRTPSRFRAVQRTVPTGWNSGNPSDSTVRWRATPTTARRFASHIPSRRSAAVATLTATYAAPDMTPATSTFNDAILPVGQTFSDPTSRNQR